MLNSKIDITKLDLKTLLGIALSIIGLYFAFYDFNYNSFKGALAETNFIYVVIASISIALSVWLRAIRWKLLIKPSNLTISQLYDIEMVGYFGNNVLPLRAGEFYRGILLSQKTKFSKSYCLGTIALERMTDMLGLVILFGVLFFFYPLPIEIQIWGNRLIFASVLGLGFLVILKKYFKSFSFFQINIIDQFLKGFTGIDLKKSLIVLGWTLVIWFVYWFDTHLIQLAFNLKMTWEQTLLVLILTSLAMAIPSAPGMIGTYHAAVKFTMVSLLGFEKDISNAFSIMLHAYGFLILTGIGAFFFIKSIKKIKI